MTIGLADAFAAYLDSGRQTNLANALRATGSDGLAAVLDADRTESGMTLAEGWPSEWRGRWCALGPTPPVGADAWSLWFDASEVVVMTLLPRPPAQYRSWTEAVQRRMTPHVGWLSLQLSRRWQAAGWAQAAGEQVELDTGADTDPATGLTGAQAKRYANHFDKNLANPNVWAAVYNAGDPLTSALWPPSTRSELAGYIGEGQVIVQQRSAALVPEPNDPDDDDPASIADESDRLIGVGFRTAISSQRPFRARPGWD